MKKLKSRRGYGFRTLFAQLVKIGPVYSIQVRLIGTWKTIYQSEHKPKFRRLYLIQFAALPFLFWQIVSSGWFLVVGMGVAVPLMWASKICLALANLLIFEFKTAKEQIEEMF